LIIHEGLEKAVVWSGALLLALPFLIAAYRKLKALSMLLAEMSAGELHHANTESDFGSDSNCRYFGDVAVGVGIKCQYFTASEFVISGAGFICCVSTVVMGAVCEATFAFANCLD
jgi:hypothetical protein